MSGEASFVPDTDSAREHIRSAALVSGSLGSVGLELEQHVLDVRRPDRRPDCDRVRAAVAGDLPGDSVVTFEPGGQLELSGPPSAGLCAAITALRADLAVIDHRLADAGLTGLLAGTDPDRNPVRVNDTTRYAAMADYFLGAGYTGPASIMMCASAALQVNVDAGPATGWRQRVQDAASLGPVIVALSACSPTLLGRRTGWVSSRMRAWADLEPPRTRPVDFDPDPAAAWADFALNAPVMMLRDAQDGTCAAVRKGVSLTSWVNGEVLLGGRRPTWADLDFHVTTLWPPLRLRGFLELRSADTSPWWAAVAAVIVACLDDPVAAGLARAATRPVSDSWRDAARHGLMDASLHDAALTCLQATLDALPRMGAAELVNEVTELWQRSAEIRSEPSR
jgi:glutamate--cysteine ligase